ncbi:MAG: hypothetical protein JWM89_1798 [Acidimicrobiales bacterium]|nr:hypothetical protein [Acidimicrobiales bacterium]
MGYLLPRGMESVRGRASGPATTGILNDLDRQRAAKTPSKAPSPPALRQFVGYRFDTYTGAPGDGSAGWTIGAWSSVKGATPNVLSGAILDPRVLGIYTTTASIEITGGPPSESIVISGLGPGYDLNQPGGGVRSLHLDSTGYGIDVVPWWGSLGPGAGLLAGAGSTNAITGMAATIAVGGFLVATR